HDLYMIMQSVSLHDVVTVEKTDTKDIKITCDVPSIPTDEKNIAYKAAKAFFDYTGAENTGIAIDIQKNIPHAAGLAGGSTDGAAVIVALGEIFGAKLKEKDIIAIGSKVGADVPFCALGGTMLAQYTGTVLSHLPDMDLPYIIIVKPSQDVSTAEAYAAFDTAERVRHLDKNGMLQAVIAGDSDKVYEKIGNVFEQFIDVTERVLIKDIMRKNGGKCACMSGSGPSVFGIFEDKVSAEKCLAELKKDYPQSYLCASVQCGCEEI
ncbi:MAG: 4-(cytidine 5'-diphospho)-2-C-methyl-D-erythritol kinase, partial [Clostridia bacterium]|nr:4-(cytidine 5'-diphospho)-2-C-methyl-D-erythritol kinase [Clostridia bacterium]